MTNIENKEYENFNTLYKELDKCYERFATFCGLPVSAMWIIYSLRSDNTESITQADISKRYFLNKQSVCSAIKKLEKDGYITMLTMPDNAKNKPLRLTEKGIKLAEEKIDKLLAAEQATFEGLTLKEQIQFIKLYSKYVTALKININSIR